MIVPRNSNRSECANSTETGLREAGGNEPISPHGLLVGAPSCEGFCLFLPCVFDRFRLLFPSQLEVSQSLLCYFILFLHSCGLFLGLFSSMWRADLLPAAHLKFPVKDCVFLHSDCCFQLHSSISWSVNSSYVLLGCPNVSNRQSWLSHYPLYLNTMQSSQVIRENCMNRYKNL